MEDNRNPIMETPEPEKDDRTDFQKRVASWSEKKWKTIQIAAGVVLGAAVTFFLFGGNEDEAFSMFTLYALVLAVFVPRQMERSCGKSVKTGRTALVITIAVGVIAQLIVRGMQQGFGLFR